MVLGGEGQPKLDQLGQVEQTHSLEAPIKVVEQQQEPTQVRREADSGDSHIIAPVDAVAETHELSEPVISVGEKGTSAIDFTASDITNGIDGMVELQRKLEEQMITTEEQAA